MTSFEIDKIESAVRQIKESIRLFFERRDPVAIHTLAFAGHKILYDLCKHRGMKDKLSYSLSDYKYVPQEMRKDWHKLLSSTANFIKHADWDGDDKILFDPKISEAFLLDATFLYQNIRTDLFHEGAVFRTWFFSKYPSAIIESEFKDKFMPLKLASEDIDNFVFIRSMLDYKKIIDNGRLTSGSS